jgi:hypothetical protein
MLTVYPRICQEADMQEPETPSTAVAVRDERDVARPLPPMNDAEVAAAYRTARAFAEGGLFKDARSAGAAFTKILAGRDFGLTPFESMSGLHVFDGKVEAGADLHATKIRQRDGYDFRVAWLKIVEPGKTANDQPKVEAVWADEEDLADLRETYGCAIMFTVDGKSRGVSRFTQADAVKAKLQGKDNHSKYPRNMFYARAMTNGVAWYVPEAMGGLRVYGLGELPRESDITDVDGATVAEAEIDLPMAVEAVVARARTVGYAPLANRAAVAMAVGGQPAEFVAQWVADRTRDLNRFAAGKAEPEPEDAEIVPDPPAQEPDQQPAPEPESEPIDAVIAEGDAAERIEALRDRALNLLADADALDEAGDDNASAVREEAEQLMDQVDAAQGPEQGRLGL